MDADGSNITILGPAFNWLDDITLDSSGRIYFVDYNNVKRMDANGTNVVIIGSGYGSPWGMTLDSSDNIYIANINAKSLQRMDSNGNNLTTLATGFDTICGVAVDSSGNIYVVDCWDDSIEKLDSNGNHLAFLGTGFAGSEGIAVDSQGNIYVAHTGNDTIKRMDASGNNIITLGYGFNSPTNIALDSSGNVFVADYGNQAIKKISPAPAYTTGASAEGSQPDAGAANQITLTVKNSFGDTDTSFSGDHDITISGYSVAPNVTYGSFNEIPLEEISTTVSLNFTSGIATADLVLNRAAAQSIGFSTAGVTTVSNTLVITPLPLAAAPQNVGTVEGDLHVELSWDPVANANAYTIYQSLTSGSYESSLDTVASSINSYDDVGLTNGTTYYFKVHAEDVYGNSSSSSEVSAMPWVPVTEAPNLTGAAGNRHVMLTWNGVPNAVSYSVYQRNASGSYESPVATVASSVNEYDVTGLTAHTEYYFKVKASSFKNNIDSNEISATPRGGGPTIINPTVTTGQASSIGGNSARLNGTIGENGNVTIKEYGFIYGISQLGLDNKTIVDINNYRGAFNCSISGLTPGKTYYYQAYALTEKDALIYGSILSFTTEDSQQQQPQPTQPPQQQPNVPNTSNQVFPDVPVDYWANNSINKLNSLGLATGYPDGNFRPAGDITRAEFVTMLVNALKLKANGSGQSFGDIPGHWAKGNIITASSLGVVTGFANNEFRPDDPITREQLAVIAVKVTGLEAVYGETSFADNNRISYWAKGSVQAAVKADILKGYPSDNTFRPQNNTTRAEAISLIFRLME